MEEFENLDPRTYEVPKPSRTPKTGRKLIVTAICCSLLGGAVGGFGVFAAMRQFPQTQTSSGVSNILFGQRENSTLEITEIDTGKLLTPAQVYAANVNSTVGITTSVTTNFWGYPTAAAAAGSGFILSDDGYIVTNHHVIENSNSITVTTYNGESHTATLIGYDKSNDIAVLKINATDLTPVVLGDSGNTNVGDSVVAIGNPLGELTFSLTAGAVSALDREVTMSNGITMDLIQTDCAINSGNSGGALFNLYGEVIGITNAKYSSSSSSEASIDNIGFAIPVNSVWDIIESIIENGYISKPYIGVSVADVSSETQSYGLPQGAAVRQVTESSPAADAGLQINDIITHIGGNPITGSRDLVRIIGDCAPGDILTLTVYRQGKTTELTLTVGEQTQSALEKESTQQSQQNSPGIFPWGYGY